MNRLLGIAGLLVVVSLLGAGCSRGQPGASTDQDLLREGRAALARGEVDRALALLGRAVEKRPGHVDTRLQLSRALVTAGRAREAEKRLREGLARSGREAALWLELGRVLAAQGKHDPAVGALEEARRLQPGNMEVVLALGRIYEEHGQGEVAGALYRASLTTADPGYRIQLHRRLARQAAKREQPMEELAELRRALALAPKRGDLLAELGRALRRAGRSAEARSALVEAVRARPEDGEARLVLGLVHQDLEEHEQAAVVLEEAARLMPGKAAPLAALCETLVAIGRRNLAHGTCVRALALAPTDARVQWLMAPLYLERGLVEPAGELLDQLEGSRAHDPAYWDLAARVAEGRQDHARAEEAWAKALTLRPRDLHLRRSLGFAARRAGDYAGALRHLEAVLRARPEDYDALVHLAIAAEFSGLRHRAIEALGRAQRLAPKRPEAIVYLSWLAQRQGRMAEALARAEQADRLANGASAAALDVMATALGSLGRRVEARAVVERALTLDLGLRDRAYLATRLAALAGQGADPGSTRRLPGVDGPGSAGAPPGP